MLVQMLRIQILKLQKHPKFIEYLIGIAITYAVMFLVLLYTIGLSEMNPIGTVFMAIIFSIAPFFGDPTHVTGENAHLLYLLVLCAFAVSFYLTVRFVKTPYLRFGIALHFGLWILYGLQFAALDY
jgi:hypothetical protein